MCNLNPPLLKIQQATFFVISRQRSFLFLIHREHPTCGYRNRHQLSACIIIKPKYHTNAHLYQYQLWYIEFSSK